MSNGLIGPSSAKAPPVPDPSPTKLSSAAGQAEASKLKSTAKEFESVLLGQWLQGAESSFGSIPGGDDDSDVGDEQMKGFAVQQLAKSFSDSGGIGIAALVSKALAHSASNSPKS